MRIFWLGMHKVLVTTELPRLRELGFEVFNPPYLSSINDQSANLNWDSTQPTTLPQDVFQKLSHYNFFYNEISHEMADILNNYFDAVIVTIAIPWLKEILRVYKKKVIYRTYGQSYFLAQELWNADLFELITERDDFWFVPHTEHTAKDEHKWLRDREEIVPYILPYDVFAYQDKWSIEHSQRKEIMLTCPNIDNPYYNHKYKFLKQHFYNECYKFYGVQLHKHKDSQVVGTLSRSEYLQRYLDSSGYLYFYTEPHVCYLPPIEMMVAGGPVIFLADSLLDRYFNDKDAPGRANTISIAKQKCQKLISKDKTFIEEVIDSQKKVRQLYSPEYVWPIFDKIFLRLLAKETANKSTNIVCTINRASQTSSKNIYFFHHFPVPPITFEHGEYAAYDGIPRVVRLIVRALCQQTDFKIILTCKKEQLVNAYGYFSSTEFLGRIQFLVVDDLKQKTNKKWKIVNLKRFLPLLSKAQNFTSCSCLKLLRFLKKFLTNLRHYKTSILPLLIPWRVFRWRFLPWLSKHFEYVYLGRKTPYVKFINKDKNCVGVIIPHYYFFPESTTIDKEIYLYLPDYIPHFFEKSGEFKNIDYREAAIGKKIAEKAKVVFTNSQFSKSYLPLTRLKINLKKIKVFYLPNLNTKSKKNELENNMLAQIKAQLENKTYIFYPTQDRPNKNLTFLLDCFSELLKIRSDLKLVLTCGQSQSILLKSKLSRFESQDKVLFLHGVSDLTLGWLYEHAACLCFTSLIEGNFPPQIFEALEYQTPIVATRLPLITERLGVYSDYLLLCEPSDLNSFVQNMLYALNNRESILEKQKVIVNILQEQDLWNNFSNEVKNLFVPVSK